MKVKIDSDEVYPVFYLDKRYGTDVNVPGNRVAKWKRIEKEYNQMQREMEDAVNGRRR